MIDLDSYFSEENIVNLLCKYRVNEAKKRHAKHMITNVSLKKKTTNAPFTNLEQDLSILQSIFPSRRDWKKLNENERKLYKDTLSINKRRLYKSYEITKKIINRGGHTPNWYKNLLDFVIEIQTDIQNIQTSKFQFNKPDIKGIKKEEKINPTKKNHISNLKKKNTIITYRPIAVYNFKDRIICSLTAKYFVTYFESMFNEVNCSYAFRPKNSNGKVPNHHDCITEILNYKNLNPKLWVAECDIQKFFDTVQHTHITKVLDNHISKIENETGSIFDLRAKKIFNLFLNSFNFQDSILSLDKDWFEEKKLPIGKFKWVENELNNKFGNNYSINNKIGVPQGNAISCFIANLIMHEVDIAVKKFDKSIFYIRYCDDMILMHSDKNKCFEALHIYMKSINDNYLLFHNPEKFLNYKNKLNSEKFWKSKSKEPFYWGDKNIHENNIPWVSFVGYQIDHYKRIRVRKSTLKKETKKQISEVQKIIKALGKLHRNSELVSENARISKEQIVFRVQQRLISMSVGRITLHNHKNPLDQGFCWTNGFKGLQKNIISSKQLKYLDKRRNIQIKRIRRELRSIEKESKNKTYPEDLKHIKFGSAYSYYNFIKHK